MKFKITKHTFRNKNVTKKKQNKTKKMIGGILPRTFKIIRRSHSSPKEDITNPLEAKNIFKNTEVNHDLSKYIPAPVNQSFLFNEYVLKTESRDDYDQSPGILLNDGKIVQQITGLTKSKWGDLEDGIYKNMDIFTIDSDQPGYIFPIIRKKTARPQYDFSLFDLHNLRREGDKTVDIFVVIDVGGILITELKDKTHPDTQVNLNICHSLATLSDSARKKSPNDKSYYESSFLNSTKIYSWNDLGNTDVDKNRSLLMTDYNISMKRMSDQNWNVRQVWTSGDTSKWSTINANVDNNITQVSKHLTRAKEDDSIYGIGIFWKHQGIKKIKG